MGHADGPGNRVVVAEAVRGGTAVVPISGTSRYGPWCNGASFDFPILATAYRLVKKPLPWEFWKERDLRTLKGLNPDLRVERDGVHHNALDDARHQARLVQHILQFNPDLDS